MGSPDVHALTAEHWGRWEAAIKARDDRALDALQRLAAVIAVTKPPSDYQPSAREIECIELAAAGKLNGAIAAELGISVETVKSHMKQATKRLGAKNRTHMVAIAWRRCLID